MTDVSFEHLFDIDIAMGKIRPVGETPSGRRVIAGVAGGTFEGPKLKGSILPGTAGDWVVLRPDGVLALDVRLTLETADGALVYMHYHGFQHGPKEVMRRIAKGEPVDPSEYYFRSAPNFETGDERYYWLNNIVAVGVGTARPQGPLYKVYQLL